MNEIIALDVNFIAFKLNIKVKDFHYVNKDFGVI